MKRLLFVLAFTGILCVIPFFGCSDAAIPAPQGYVNDFANLISDDVENSLELSLSRYESETSNELAVVTVKSLGGKSIEDYTISLAEKWGVGQKDKDNGVVILVAAEEREVRIEVGYGLEPDLTDAQAKLIIENEMLPRFRNNDYDNGIQAGVNAIMGTISGTYIPNKQTEEINIGDIPLWVWPVLIGFGMVFSLLIYIINQIGRMHKGRYNRWNTTSTKSGPTRYWGGFGGGGFSGGGFGGGSFGGGGAGGHW